MLHITEDTPADMLSGAMDLTIHLPSGKAVKMCVERRTPMMDLLVQVTTNHQLQITNYTLQPLQTSSSDNYSEKVLSYYPNTPIGALDTQYMKVIPKARILPNTKNLPPGTKPFETTFRLKVHLPRNQLYVTRVSKHVHIGDIMRKVCEEKNLDPKKYEVRHPGNLEEILDPKLTLNDYMITEINLVVKGSKTNTHTFTSEDIMSLRKNEERKPIPSKPGGVFSLLFRRGKSNNVPPSSKEYTPPPSKEDQDSKLAPSTVPIVPKVPQRKRRPAPKPPQTVDKIPPPSEKLPQEEPVQLRSGSVISDNSNCSENDVKIEPGLTIYHSRHSSDSSGYHETSILSDQCNTSLPRRNRLDAGCETMGRKLNRYSESTGNLTKMTSHSRSTSSLIFPGRKKKAAPAPPKPLLKFASSTTNLETLSPVVASQSPLSTSSSKTGKSTHLDASMSSVSVVRGLEFGRGEKRSYLKTYKNYRSALLNSKAKKCHFKFVPLLSLSGFFPCTSSKEQDNFKGTQTLGNIYKRNDINLELDSDDTLTVIAYPSEDQTFDENDNCVYDIFLNRNSNERCIEDSESCSSYGSDFQISIGQLNDNVYFDEKESSSNYTVENMINDIPGKSNTTNQVYL